MTTPHRATPEQWKKQERSSAAGAPFAVCILELRDRVKALEASLHPRVFTADELKPIVVRSADSLVERVSRAINPSDDDGPPLYLDEARAAIREVAAWLRKNPGPNSAWLAVARDLMDEANQ